MKIKVLFLIGFCSGIMVASLCASQQQRTAAQQLPGLLMLQYGHKSLQFPGDFLSYVAEKSQRDHTKFSADVLRKIPLAEVMGEEDPWDQIFVVLNSALAQTGQQKLYRPDYIETLNRNMDEIVARFVPDIHATEIRR